MSFRLQRYEIIRKYETFSEILSTFLTLTPAWAQKKSGRHLPDYYSINVNPSERHADGEVEGIVAAEAGMDKGKVFLVGFVTRIDGLHAEVET